MSSCSGGDRDGNQGRGVVGKDNGIREERVKSGNWLREGNVKIWTIMHRKMGDACKKRWYCGPVREKGNVSKRFPPFPHLYVIGWIMQAHFLIGSYLWAIGGQTIDDVTNDILLLYYINIKNMVRDDVTMWFEHHTHTRLCLVCQLFWILPHFDIICYYWTEAWQHEISCSV